MKIDLKRKEIACAIILLLIVVVIAPGINANILNKKIEVGEEPACLGSIYGHTGEGFIWGFAPVSFAKVQAGCKTTISGPILGKHKIRGLPLGTYTVTGSKPGYITYTTTVTLTKENPVENIRFDLDDNGDKTEKTTEKNTINNNGKISGDVKTPGFSLLVPVPGIRMACGKNYDEYVTTVTDDSGEFEFTDLTYEDSGTVYKVFMLKTPGLIHVRQKKRVTLDSENPEVEIHFILPFVFFNREVENRPMTLGR